MDDAACKGLPGEWFFADGESDKVGLGLAVCARCPVRTECGDYADTEGIRYGLWGGIDRRRRVRL